VAVVLLAFVAAFVPALLWLVFIYRRDRYESEPKTLIARLFLWGLAAGPWASGMNILIAHLFAPSIDSAQRAELGVSCVCDCCAGCRAHSSTERESRSGCRHRHRARG
jgi:hypothetical protein